jgi:Zn-dependent M28 family amino/carboxypeptidase
LRVQGKREMLPAFNVIGRIQGVGTATAPELASQAIVISAHYDHLDVVARNSTDPAVVEDVINNGADDDASGCSAVLELAEAFGAGPAPARTLIFFFATGEEIGLLGTDWYIEHPVVPLANTVCNLNFEMIGRPDPLAGGPGKMWLTGYELSNLGPEFAKAGLAVVVDPRPKENFFRRSDNIAFVNRGIVGQTLSTFNLHTDYHHVTDEADKLDYQHMEGCVKAGLECARMLASGAITPAWNPGMEPKH